MKFKFIIFSLVCVFITGCLGEMRANNAARHMNEAAANEESPYRWRVIPIDFNSARLEQVLSGTPSDSVLKGSHYDRALSEISQKLPAPAEIKVNEIRVMNKTLGNYLAKEVIEAWVVNSGGQEYVFTLIIQTSPEINIYAVRGPWMKET